MELWYFSQYKEKYVSSGYGIAFDSGGFWSLHFDTARNVITFGVDNSSLSHAKYRKNNFLVLVKGPSVYCIFEF